MGPEQRRISMMFKVNHCGSSNPGKEGNMPISELIGSSPKFMRVFEDVRTVGAVACAVLIQGETGTGKEVIARAIDDASSRRQHRRPSPAALLERELFGYERSAFTGAMTPRMGSFQAAGRGTLFRRRNWRIVSQALARCSIAGRFTINS